MAGRRRSEIVVVCCVLALGTLLLYAPALQFTFLNYDDQFYVTSNPHVNQGFSLAQFQWCFQAGYAGNWHPLTWMSHTLDCQLYGLKPAGHHATNILLHSANAVLAFLVLLRLTGAFWRSAAVAALFAWHPLHVESVAWVSERKDVLSAFFFFLTIMAYVRYTQEADTGGPKVRRFYIVALILFVLGLMSKPMLVTVPFVLLLLDWWPLGRMSFGPAAGKRLFELALEKVPFLLLSIGTCVLTVIAQHRQGAVWTLNQASSEQRLSDVLVAYCQYVGKTFWPRHLAAIYPLLHVPALWAIPLAGIFLAAVTGLACVAVRERPWFLAGWLWFLGMLVPVSGIVQVGAQSMADRYTYLPSIGLFVMICWGTHDAASRWRWPVWVPSILAVTVAGTCLALTNHQLPYWRNPSEVFLRAIEVTEDNYVAYTGYAEFLVHHREWRQAEFFAKKALRISSNFSVANWVMALSAFDQKRYDDVKIHLQDELNNSPEEIGAKEMLAQTYLLQTNPVAAAGQYRLLTARFPDDVEAHCSLGNALAQAGNLGGAIAEFHRALALDYGYPDAHYQLAMALSAQNQTREAIAHYRVALHFCPDYPQALNNLAWLLATSPEASLRDGPEAVRLARRACDLTRNTLAPILGTLGAACAEAGRFDDAIAAAQQAHDLALAHGDQDVAARNLELLELYRSHRPFHEAPSPPPQASKDAKGEH